MSSQMTMFEGLLEAMPDALVGVDKAGVIRYVNHRTESLFGYDRDDLVGAPLETLVPESLRKVHKVHREGYNGAPGTRLMGTGLKSLRKLPVRPGERKHGGQRPQPQRGGLGCWTRPGPGLRPVTSGARTRHGLGAKGAICASILVSRSAMSPWRASIRASILVNRNRW
jgi:PAS fold